MRLPARFRVSLLACAAAALGAPGLALAGGTPAVTYVASAPSVGTSGSSGPVAPAASPLAMAGLSDLDAKAIVLAIGYRHREEVQGWEKLGVDEQASKTVALWDKYWSSPADKALFLGRVAYLGAHFAEPGTGPLDTERGLTFLLEGPPVTIRAETARDWAGKPAFTSDAAGGLPRLLAYAQGLMAADLGHGSPSGSPPPAAALAGAHPTQTWDYLLPDNKRWRLRFVDADGSGHFRFAATEIAETAETATAGEVEELPPDLFEQAVSTQALAPLPEVTTKGLTPTVQPVFFKADAGRTHVRLVVSVDPSDIELELNGKPDEYEKKAQVWVRLEQDGKPVFQDSRKAATTPFTKQDGLWLSDLGAPLLPGTYQWRAVITDGAGAGGDAKGTLAVPPMVSKSGGPVLSSVVIARAEGHGSATPLPLAPAGATGATGPAAGAEPDRAPFQMGRYVIAPRMKGVYKAGESLAVAFQVYCSAPTVVSVGFYRDGKYQPGIDDATVNAPSLLTYPQDVTADWPAGSYEVKVTATDAADKEKTCTQSATFRVAS